VPKNGERAAKERHGLAERRWGKVCVAKGHPQVGVAQEFSDHVKRDAAQRELRAEGVPQGDKSPI